MVLWFVFNFMNSYSNQINIDTTMITFIMLFLPACLAIISSYKSKKVFMLIAFIFSLPMSVYCLMTPSIFAFFGITSFTYLVSFLLMLFKK